MDRSVEGRAGLITGASSGIGRALAVVMAEKGYDLALFARREDRLESLKAEIEEKFGRRVFTFSCDVRNEKDMRKCVPAAVEALGRLDVLVSNAGYTIPGAFADLGVEDYRCIFDTNFFGMLNTIYPALDALRESEGTVVIVGSILGELGIMDRSAYVATKFAIRGFYESVRYEFKEMGVSVLLAEPGFVKTELRFMDRQGERLRVVTDSRRKETSHGIAVPPVVVARQIVRHLPMKGYKRRIITGHAHVMAFFNRLSPGMMTSIIYQNRDVIRKKIVK